MYNYYLAHHGILGMKWGVRRYQNADGSLTAAGRRRYGNEDVFNKRQKMKNPSREELVTSTDAEQIYKYRDRLSDKELRDRVNRIQTEQQLEQLVKSSSKKGHGVVSKFMKQVETGAITAAAVGTVALGKKVLTSSVFPALTNIELPADWFLP